MAEEYEVLFDWEPEKPEDLRLFAGEDVVVLQKHEHGWWLGSIDRQGTLFKGYFPRNYVKERPRANPAPRPPPRPTSLSQRTLPEPSPVLSALSLSEGAGEETRKESQRLGRGPTFSLKSLPAFDDLLQKGYAVEVAPSSQTSGPCPLQGERVELQVRASTWDGAAGGATRPFAEGGLKFVVGERQVVSGLDAAVLSLSVGQSATVTCSPAKAYGNAGCPPAVPPNAFVVFDLTLLSCTPMSPPFPAAEGPAALLVGDLPEVRREGPPASRRESHRLLLSPPGDKADSEATDT